MARTEKGKKQDLIFFYFSQEVLLSQKFRITIIIYTTSLGVDI